MNNRQGAGKFLTQLKLQRTAQHHANMAMSSQTQRKAVQTFLDYSTSSTKDIIFARKELLVKRPAYYFDIF